MQALKFYDKIPTMECLQGDTLETFQIQVDNASDCTMQVILEDKNLLGTAKLTKNCTFSDGCFQVQLTSNDTSSLHGTYYMHFSLKNADGLIYRKIAGVLIVRPTAQGE